MASHQSLHSTNRPLSPLHICQTTHFNQIKTSHQLAYKPTQSTPRSTQNRLHISAISQSGEPAIPPYSALSTPVYSLSTIGATPSSPSTMNLVTYASPISLKPRHYSIGLYVNTLSWENMLATRHGVLQILTENHAHLFHLLGKQSGRDVDKLEMIQQQGHALSEYKGIPILADCFGFMYLTIVDSQPPVSAGDHDIVLCTVDSYETLSSSDSPPLYTGYLKQCGYM